MFIDAIDRIIEEEMVARNGNRQIYSVVLQREMETLARKAEDPLTYFVERTLKDGEFPYHIPDLGRVDPKTYFLTPGSPGRAAEIGRSFTKALQSETNARAFTLHPGSTKSLDGQHNIPSLALTTHMGGPTTDIAVREIIANMYVRHGVRMVTTIRPGSSGATVYDNDGEVIEAGDLFFADYAVFDPLFQRYLGLSTGYKANAHQDVLQAMEKAADRLREEGVKVHRGGTYSKLFLSEGEFGLGADEIARYHAKVKALVAATGCIATEMEGAFIGRIAEECQQQYGINHRQGTMGYFVGQINEDGHEQSFVPPEITVKGLTNLMTFIKYTVQELHVIDAMRHHASD